MEYNFNWKSLSAVAGLTLLNFYFRLYPGAVKSEQVVEFLAALRRHLRGPLLVVCARAPQPAGSRLSGESRRLDSS